VSCECSTKKSRRRVVGVTISTDDGIQARGTLYSDGSIEADPASVRKATNVAGQEVRGYPVTPVLNDPRATRSASGLLNSSAPMPDGSPPVSLDVDVAEDGERAQFFPIGRQ
jgi:hypothetical protein